jgi:hypothetical protein
VDALACKAIANLQLGEYEEAAKVLSHKQLQQEMHFERVSTSLQLLLINCLLRWPWYAVPLTHCLI